MEVSKDSKFTFSLETLISLGTTLVLVVGMWFTLQADIKEAKELPEPPIGRTEYDLKDQMIRNTIIETEKITIDGLRVNFSDGWGLLRASNTTPKLVLRFEANSPVRLDEIQNIFLNQLKKIDETINIELS